ncbi:hypothetical protein [Hymenobacter sp. B81]|uniref:hypothetical protein n=1 Tax=Hymenobacter sp. B81 TaxID=3344878 RepID=UPI0037DD67A7
MKKTFAALVLTVALSGQSEVALAQCAMCKTNVESGRESAQDEGYDFSGLNSGILYLMAVPYVLIGSVGYFWYRNSQRKKQQAASA